tara:strand:- start:189 stop:431 length:243 start_codon:yes stop_codon:yes gene_type:complete
MEEDKKLVQIVVHEDPTRLTSVYCSTDEEEKEEHQHEVMEQLAEVGVDLGKEDIVLHIPYPYLPKKYVSATLGADSEKLP